ncbi:MAG: hypothetical protein K0R54_309 [Clostridiaceae bacterium]|jgi:hypothetical protein|nr:hypothetical protein [Clostridiaceae bacterium]
MSKYKVGEELIIVDSPSEDVEKLQEMTKLEVRGDFAEISYGLKIKDVKYDRPNITLTYRNLFGEENKVFAVCKDIKNYDKEKVLEKVLLKAFQGEINNLSVNKNN